MVNVISRQNNSAAAGAVPQSGKAQPAPAAKAAKADAAQSAPQVTVSGKARLAQQVAQAARASDGVDAEKVAQVQKSIDQGTYAVSPDVVAQALVTAAKETKS